MPHVVDTAHRFLSTVVTLPAAGRTSGRLFTAGNQVATGERIALSLAADGTNGDGVLGATDFGEISSAQGVELIIENMEWFSL